MPEIEDVNQFADAVVQYCSFIEHCQDFDSRAFARECARLLSSLYLLALELPNVSTGSKEALRGVISRETWWEIAGEISEKFDVSFYYWEVFDPFELTEPVAGDLRDDLADIYSDLMTGLTAFQSGSEEQRLQAIWHWKFLFNVHWGKHLVSALRPIHAILAGPLADE